MKVKTFLKEYKGRKNFNENKVLGALERRFSQQKFPKREHFSGFTLEKGQVSFLIEHFKLQKKISQVETPVASICKKKEIRIEKDLVQIGLELESADSYKVLIHKEVKENKSLPERLTDRRLQFCLHQFVTSGKTDSWKSTSGANYSWKRTPVKGNHYYLWWTTYGTKSVPSDWPSRSVFLRQVRHHDNHNLIHLGKLSEYRRLSEEYKDWTQLIQDPWTENQKEFFKHKEAIRILTGTPGSGKTSTLLKMMGAEHSQKVLYLTLSDSLVQNVREDPLFIEGRMIARSFKSMVEEILELVPRKTQMPEVRPLSLLDEKKKLEDFKRKVQRISLGSWKGREDSLYAEIRAYIAGRRFPRSRYIQNFIPEDSCDLEEESNTDNALHYLAQLVNGSYANYRFEALGQEACEVVQAVVKQIGESELTWTYWPDLQMAYEACKTLQSVEGDTLEKYKDIGRIVVDEVQDLTPVEAMVLFLFVRRLAEIREQLPFLSCGGDEGQTIRPSGFGWGWFKGLIYEIFGLRPAGVDLSESLRSPLKVVRLIHASNQLYKKVAKDERPKKGLKAESSRVAFGSLIHCCFSTEDDSALLGLLEQMDKMGCKFIHFGHPLPKIIREHLSDGSLFTVEEAKGHEFDFVCLLEPEKHLNQIFESKVGDSHENTVHRLWRRTAIDQFRVAISRTKDLLVFLNIGEGFDAFPHSEEVLSEATFTEEDELSIYEYLTEEFSSLGALNNGYAELVEYCRLPYEDYLREGVEKLGVPQTKELVSEEVFYQKMEGLYQKLSSHVQMNIEELHSHLLSERELQSIEELLKEAEKLKSDPRKSWSLLAKAKGLFDQGGSPEQASILNETIAKLLWFFSYQERKPKNKTELSLLHKSVEYFEKYRALPTNWSDSDRDQNRFVAQLFEFIAKCINAKTDHEKARPFLELLNHLASAMRQSHWEVPSWIELGLDARKSDWSRTLKIYLKTASYSREIGRNLFVYLRALKLDEFSEKNKERRLEEVARNWRREAAENFEESEHFLEASFLYKQNEELVQENQCYRKMNVFPNTLKFLKELNDQDVTSETLEKLEQAGRPLEAERLRYKLDGKSWDKKAPFSSIGDSSEPLAIALTQAITQKLQES